MNTGHLFAGAGGGLLADLILGHKSIEAVEIKSKFCEIIQSKRQAGWFPAELKIRNIDIQELNGLEWKGRVDLIHAGIPCPFWSNARHGTGKCWDGWPPTLRIISEAKPKYVFIECVENFKREHGRIKSDLQGIEYGLTDYIILDAAFLGAPHSRRRYWSLGYSYDQGKPVYSFDAEMAVMPPPDVGMWWEAKPNILRMAHGVANRVDRFQAIGNGQVPLQAAAAYILLGGPLGS